MMHKIKELADEAIALQNKNAMDAALREIGVLAHESIEASTPVAGAIGNAAKPLWPVAEVAPMIKAVFDGAVAEVASTIKKGGAK